MSRCGVRMLCVLLLTWCFLYMVDGWFLASFFSGMLLCELDMLAVRGRLPRLVLAAEPCGETIFTGMLIASIYIGGVPVANDDFDELKKSPGWQHLSILKPDATRHHFRFFIFWTAMAWLKALFNTQFCQHLGKISFSLYLMHGPVVWTSGDVVSLFLGWPKEEADYQYPSYYNKLPITRAGPTGHEPAFWVGQLVLLPATLWVSNIVTMLIDEPSVRFAAWLRSKTLPQRC